MNLISQYDYLGWVPNIKSDLSYSKTNDIRQMNTFDNFAILGYADKLIGNLSFARNINDANQTFSRVIVCTGLGDIHDKLDIKKVYAPYTRYFLFLSKDIETGHLVGQILFSHTNGVTPCKEEMNLLEYFNQIRHYGKEYQKLLNEFSPYENLGQALMILSEKVPKLETNIATSLNSLAAQASEEDSWLKKKHETPECSRKEFERIHFLVNIRILKSGIVLLKLDQADLDVIDAFHGSNKYYHQTPRH